jgi:nucleotide-binding universal stress UspA family protein
MYQHILVAVDGSDTSDLGLAEAIRLAVLTKGRLRLLHVIDTLSLSLGLSPHGSAPVDWLTPLRTSGTELLQRAKAMAAASGVQAETVLHESLSDTLADTVAAQAASWPADVIVLGPHGRRGLGRLLLGSDADMILRTASVPVLLVRAPKAGAPGALQQAAQQAWPAAAQPLA